MKATLAILGLLFLSWFAVAQTPAGELNTESKKAKKLYLEAEKLYLNRKWDEAAELLTDALKADENFAEAHLRLGNMQILSSDAKLKNEGLEHLKSYIKLQHNSYQMPEIALRVSKYYADSGKYEQAAQWFQYIPQDALAGNKIFDKLKRTLNFFSKNTSVGNKLDIKPLPKSINCLPLQYSPSVTGDGNTMIFTGRKGSQPQNDEDVYESIRNAQNQWLQAHPVPGRINTTMNEGSVSITADGRTMVFTGCERKDGKGSCDIYISVKEAGIWGEPKNIVAINTKAWESQPSLSADGRDLYFSSNRANGLGGYDIWVSHLTANNQWTEPENLGPSVNTESNEYTPFIHANNMLLYFATDGRPGMGGLDLFYSRRIKNGWEEALNLGLPINTHLEESSLVVAPDGKTAYFNEEIRDNRNIKQIRIMEYPVPHEWKVKPICTYVRGQVYDAKTKQPLMASIQLIDLDNDSTSYSVKSDPITGNYLAIINAGKNYALYVSYPGYLFASKFFESADSLTPSEINFPLEKISKGGRATLNNLFFDFNKASLRSQSITELKKLANMLFQNPNIKITIEGHTDEIGTDATNQLLSEKRALAVRDYLVSLKIPATRIKTIGYGKTRPVVKQGGAQIANRRIEFVIN